MSASSSAANARTARRHNERSVLAELRRAGAASKPEIARRISLTPQAVNGIFDKLLRSGLIREGGRRGGTVGHPATLYAIRPEGAYAIGIDIGPRSLEIALIDFCGKMTWRAQSDYPRPGPEAVRDAIAAGLETVQAHARAAAIDPARIVGIGVSEPAFLRAGAMPQGWERVSFADLLPSDGGLPLHLERAAVVGALALSMLADEPLPQSYLYLAIGEGVEACLVLDGEVWRGAHGRAGRFDALQVPPSAGGKGSGRRPLPLADLAGFAALRRILAATGFHAVGTDDFYAAVHERPEAVKRWTASRRRRGTARRGRGPGHAGPRRGGPAGRSAPCRRRRHRRAAARGLSRVRPGCSGAAADPPGPPADRVAGQCGGGRGAAPPFFPAPGAADRDRVAGAGAGGSRRMSATGSRTLGRGTLGRGTLGRGTLGMGMPGMGTVWEESFGVAASDGATVPVHRWQPARAARAVLVVSHGLGEHALRYRHVGTALAQRGYAVYANDHRGHGMAACRAAALGDFGPGGFAGLVADLHRVVLLAALENPGRPLLLLGHSMGAWAVQLYLLEHGSQGLAGVAYCGGSALDLLARRVSRLDPACYAVNDAFEPARTAFDWLSRDPAVVDRYLDDPLCGFNALPASRHSMMAAGARLRDPEELRRIRPDLPVLMFSGERDPVNGFLDYFRAQLDRYRGAGLRDVTARVYPGARHEMFNETNRAEVMADLLLWLDGVLAERRREPGLPLGLPACRARRQPLRADA